MFAGVNGRVQQSAADFRFHWVIGLMVRSSAFDVLCLGSNSSRPAKVFRHAKRVDLEDFGGSNLSRKLNRDQDFCGPQNKKNGPAKGIGSLKDSLTWKFQGLSEYSQGFLRRTRSRNKAPLRQKQQELFGVNQPGGFKS